MAKDLQGKVAIITGDASGIGRALAEEISSRGGSVVLRGASGHEPGRLNEFYIVFTMTANTLWRLNRYAPDVPLRLRRIAVSKFRKSRQE